MADIPVNERLILALDVEDADKARAVIRTLGDEVQFYKLGLELLMGGKYFDLIEELKQAGKRIFVDLKFFDVPRTVGAAVRELNRWGVDYATVHGNDEIMLSAVEASDNVKILAVTVLTSLDRADLMDLGFDCKVEDLVISRARRALHLGCAGVISSGLEVPVLREHFGERLLVATPGIRPIVDEGKRFKKYREAVAKRNDNAEFNRSFTIENAQYDLNFLDGNNSNSHQSSTESEKWLSKAAEQGDSNAQYHIGLMYKSIHQSDKEAIKWWKKAAMQGNRRAQNNLGAMYANGEGVRQNDEEAIKWLVKAAERGFVTAEKNLGLMYLKEKGASKSDKIQLKLYSKPLKKRNSNIKVKFGDQKRVVTPSQAFANGANHIVVGRPILGAEKPKEAAAYIQSEIRHFFKNKE